MGLYAINKNKDGDHTDNVIGQSEHIGNNSKSSFGVMSSDQTSFDSEFPPLKSTFYVSSTVTCSNHMFNRESVPKKCNTVSKAVKSSLCFSKPRQLPRNVHVPMSSCPSSYTSSNVCS